MDKVEKLKIETLYEAINKILTFTQGMKSVEDLTLNIMVWDTVKMNLVVIYETYLKLDSNFKDKYKHVDWDLIEDYKPILESQYLGFDGDEIWKAIQDKLPGFWRQISEIKIEMEK